ncbi:MULTISPECIES: AraC family transcriptional regulator [Kribbella]|nr:MULTISPECIES: AraC family transcriptional regulator [Kribbella]
MDVLSDVIAAMRTGTPHSTRHELYAPWGMFFPSSQGAGFHVVLQGSCWLIPPPNGTPIALGPGDVAFVHGETSHGLADSPSTPLAEIKRQREPYSQVRGEGSGAATVVLCGAYMLDETRAHPLLSEVQQIVHLPAQVGCHSSLRATVDLLGSELERPLLGFGAIVPALLDTLLLYILRAWFDQEPHNKKATGWVAALNDPAIAAALTSIHDDPAHPWTVEQLGAEAGLSRAAFARRFTVLIGQPPLTYLTWWRMTTGARLLRESDAPLRVISQQAGYTSDIAFSAAFKRQYGVTPGRYRRNQMSARRPTATV